MSQKGFLWIGATALVALAVACGGSDQKPVSPTSPTVSANAAGANAAGDGVTLKVNGPTPASPKGGARLTTAEAVLSFQAATGKYVQLNGFTYRVQLLNAGGGMLEEQTGQGLSYTMKTALDSDTQYGWRVRAEMDGHAGAWSATEIFKSMERPTGYIRGDEVYDPLTDGKSIGQVNGDVTWIPGVGIQLNNFYSNIEYHIPQTILRGEYSCIISGLTTSGAGGKTKVFAMGQGADDIVTNDRRMTVEKRVDGTIAWRFITHDDQVDTEGAERVQFGFRKANTYFWKATWDGSFRVQIWDGGVNGNKVYDFAKGYDGRDYDPNPHYAWAGAPVGRSGPDGATVPGMIIRQIWISSRPRPSWANQ